VSLDYTFGHNQSASNAGQTAAAFSVTNTTMSTVTTTAADARSH